MSSRPINESRNASGSLVGFQHMGNRINVTNTNRIPNATTVQLGSGRLHVPQILVEADGSLGLDIMHPVAEQSTRCICLDTDGGATVCPAAASLGESCMWHEAQPQSKL